MTYTIRPSVQEDIPRMLEIFQKAKEHMRAEGNLRQWKDYPKAEQLLRDMERQQSYVILEDGDIIATFVFMMGEEPTYAYIEDGAWLNDETYGTIHRIASDGLHRGILKAAVEFGRQYAGNIRLDTHEKNISMRNAAEKLGFVRCGIIYVSDANSDHEPRVAYQLLPDA